LIPKLGNDRAVAVSGSVLDCVLSVFGSLRVRPAVVEEAAGGSQAATCEQQAKIAQGIEPEGLIHSGTLSIPDRTLTPLDSPIFDDDVLAEMEGHVDEVIPCGGCGDRAAWRVEMRCCHADGFVCSKCRARMRGNALLQEILRGSRANKCVHCDHEFPIGLRFKDVVLEVPL
jgi:hypothetical protein